MKLLLLIFCLILISPQIIAADEVFLDLRTPIHKYDTGKLNYENKKLDSEEDENYIKPSFYTIKKMFDEDFRSDKKDTGRKAKY